MGWLEGVMPALANLANARRRQYFGRTFSSAFAPALTLPALNSFDRRRFCASPWREETDAGLAEPNYDPQGGSVDVIMRQQLRKCRHWKDAFAWQHKDRRYYEIVEDTLHPEFDYSYFALRKRDGEIWAVQPFFILDLDVLAGIPHWFGRCVDAIRRFWPRFMILRTLMVGCAAGEGHLDGDNDLARAAIAKLLAQSIVRHARAQGARLIVLKEFPKKYRRALSSFVEEGFARIPSMPQTRLGIVYPSFDDYMQSAINSDARRKLRKKFFVADQGLPIELTVVTDVSPIIDEIYGLYLQVYHRATLRFEKLTKSYFCALGATMSDKSRFFVWRRNQEAIAFCNCMVHGDTMYVEYLGLDYSIALELHLYHYVFRDLVRWAIANGYKWIQNGSLNYDPKLHFRHRLDPIDLYVKHTSTMLNAAMRIGLPWLEPTRFDNTLKKFPNYYELWY
jgi:hypothetical protein